RLTSNGFTLVEIIVILAVISILVAILTPTVLKYIDEARDDRAREDVKNISAMLNDLIKDTGQYPGDKASKSFLCGPGTIVNGSGWASGTSDCTTSSGKLSDSISNHLVVNDPNEDATTGGATDYRSSGNRRWKGPYVTSLSEDPWGNAYQVNVSTLKGADTNPTWVISAGPNGTFNTSTSADTLSSDDIGVRIK
ncbi:MAG: type II secretion system protein GspG, partial [Deltaproteobacteria bacterium]|nr:type II secretion system protein GspG [Deltaproteobacteria bacterium]